MVHSHERQRLRVHLRLCQNDNIVSMRMLCQTQRMGVGRTHSLHLMQQLTNMLQFDANANAHANVDARVNGPLRFKSIIYHVVYVGSCPRGTRNPFTKDQ